MEPFRSAILVTPAMNEHIIVVIPRDRCSDEGARWFISLIDDGFERTGIARQGEIEVTEDCFIARYFQFAWKGSAA